MIHYNDSSVYYNYPGYHFSQNIDSTVYHNSEEEEKEKNILCSSTSLPQCPQVPHMSLDLWSYQYSTTRYLIIKPWAPQDLERSYQIGYWSIPLNKVDYLNAIFETTKDIYLIFSLTRSGGYFGYAQMLSPVVDVLSCHQSGRGYSLTNTPFERKNNNKQKSKLGKNKAKEGNLKTINCLGILSLP
ncbi:hypothetical protein BDF14DRAFT_917112 [Spinellus fusiger]|nr:hypothetical protein BDF14DRAFT_917112 [Spinellus fusiger]